MAKSPTRYVALLRGINVGGNKKVPMADLKTMLESLGYENVKTLLASGNALFDTGDKPAGLKQAFENAFSETFGFTSSVIIRPQSDLQAMVKLDPFNAVKVTPQTRLYVTFLPAKTKCTLKLPYVAPELDYKILSHASDALFSVLTLTEKSKGTTDSMAILDKEFGKEVTTRNWNTVLKLAK